VNNLFSSLSRYAFRQEENFLTESLVYLLNSFLEREAEIGLAILARLCGDKTKDWFDQLNQIAITTQFTVEEGRPDIIIEIGLNKIVFIEVKHDSSLGFEQLESYYSHLRSLQTKETQLVLLTRSRHSIQGTSLDRHLFHHVCWYEISGWLSEAEIQDEVISFLIEQFLEFLKEKGMNMEKVTWEYIRGVPAMVNLVNMIGTAISEVAPESSVRKTVGASWAGYYLEGIFIGFRFADPLLVVFENNAGNSPTFKRDLYLEKAHFFSLSAGEQLECLIEFVGTSLDEFSKQDVIAP
jgi:hypothetical protein